MEGTIGELVNTEGASVQHIEGMAWGTDREGVKQAKLSFPPAEKTALSAKLQQERRVKLKSRRQSSKRPTHRTTRLLNHKRQSTKRARRSSQTNLESISSRRLSKCDLCHRTKKVTNVPPQLFQAFQTQLGSPNILCSKWSGPCEWKRSRKSQGPKRDSDAEFKSRLEVARKQAFDIFISVDW